MARGISAFTAFTHRANPIGHVYGCPWCRYQIQLGRMGNAFRRAAKGKAAIRKHVLEKHPEQNL